MGGRTNRKADFELPSAEGDWGYPEDMLLRPSHNGGNSNGNGNGARPHDSEPQGGEVASGASHRGSDQDRPPSSG
jgi:hypothetical protein